MHHTASDPWRTSARSADELHAAERHVVLVPMLVRSLRQLDGFPLHLFVRNERQNVLDAIEACLLLVVASDHVPWCFRAARRLKHRIPRAGIIVPARIGL